MSGDDNDCFVIHMYVLSLGVFSWITVNYLLGQFTHHHINNRKKLSCNYFTSSSSSYSFVFESSLFLLLMTEAERGVTPAGEVHT